MYSIASDSMAMEICECIGTCMNHCSICLALRVRTASMLTSKQIHVIMDIIKVYKIYHQCYRDVEYEVVTGDVQNDLKEDV